MGNGGPVCLGLLQSTDTLLQLLPRGRIGTEGRGEVCDSRSTVFFYFEEGRDSPDFLIEGESFC